MLLCKLHKNIRTNLTHVFCLYYGHKIMRGFVALHTIILIQFVCGNSNDALFTNREINIKWNALERCDDGKGVCDMIAIICRINALMPFYLILIE